MRKYHVIEMGKNNKKVIFLLAGWYNKPWMFWLFSQILSHNGWYCITYTYDGDVFSPNTKATSNYLCDIRDEVLLRINKLKNNGYMDFSVFGTSLGSIVALMVANQSPDITRVILNTTGVDVSEAVWGWEKENVSFKQELLNQNLTLGELKRLWHEITPASNFNKLKNKKLLIYLSLRDEVIPFDLGERLVKEFEKRRYDYTLVTNTRLKHFYAGAYNLLNAGRYLTFLNE